MALWENELNQSRRRGGGGTGATYRLANIHFSMAPSCHVFNDAVSLQAWISSATRQIFEGRKASKARECAYISSTSKSPAFKLSALVSTDPEPRKQTGTRLVDPQPLALFPFMKLAPLRSHLGRPLALAIRVRTDQGLTLSKSSGGLGLSISLLGKSIG